MSLTHFNPYRTGVEVKYGLSPCGKQLRLCNWSTGESGVTCKKCLQLMVTT